MTAAALTAITLLLQSPSLAQALTPRLSDGQLVASAPTLRFLEGKPLDRLRNGQSVTFDFQLQLLDGAKPIAKSLQRFVLSYDLWEETFSAVQLSQSSPRTPVFSTSRLKADGVATWCLGRMQLPLPAIDKSKPLTLQLEIRTAGTKLSNPVRPQGSVDLAVLVDIFSRPPDPKDSHITALSPPFTLGNLAHP